MNNNRREFIKHAGAGIVGVGGGFFGLGSFAAFGDKEGIGPDGFEDFGKNGVAGMRFPRASPESQGVSSQAIRQFVAAANASSISWHSFMLLRHGQVVAEGWWDPYQPSFVHSLYSLSKSFTSTAIGLLVK